MPFVEGTTREELSDAVRAELSETLLVTMMNLEIGRREMKALLDGDAALKEHFGIPQ